MKRKYFYIIGDKLQIYKIKAETMEKCFEFVISPLAIKYQLNNNNIEELLKTLEKELKKDKEDILNES